MLKSDGQCHVRYNRMHRRTCCPQIFKLNAIFGHILKINAIIRQICKYDAFILILSEYFRHLISGCSTADTPEVGRGSRKKQQSLEYFVIY